MEYSDNPRKVYGKVEIVYSDKEISSNMGITVSGNSKISHPREVFEGYVSPTVRACTMDGNSDMSGSYQMVDDTCIVGWWSGGLCGTEGVFTVKPYIELAGVSSMSSQYSG